MATELGTDPILPRVAAPAAGRGPADRLMRRVLRLPVDAPAGTAEGARQAFQTSLLVATVRCLLMYIVFPFVLPAVGWRATSGRRSGWSSAGPRSCAS